MSNDSMLHRRGLQSLGALAEEERFQRRLCVSLEPRRRVLDGIEIFPWREFVGELWSGAYSR
jgi:hypothetical protein